MLLDLLIGGYQKRETVRLGLGHDHPVERIARPFLVEPRTRNGEKGTIAYANPEFVLNF
jgi:hypothetical protein